MQRDKHLFRFKGNEIHEAAIAEHDYHYEAADLWKSRVGEAQGSDADAEAKAKAHELSATQFLIEADLYGKFSEDSFLLDIDDVIYFRLVAGISREE